MTGPGSRQNSRQVCGGGSGLPCVWPTNSEPARVLRIGKSRRQGLVVTHFETPLPLGSLASYSPATIRAISVSEAKSLVSANLFPCKGKGQPERLAPTTKNRQIRATRREKG
jgi:hypothetical protein